MNKKEIFLGKKCQVTYNTGFVLKGIIKDIDEAGIVLETEQKTSFISWNSIRDIISLVN